MATGTDSDSTETAGGMWVVAWGVGEGVADMQWRGNNRRKRRRLCQPRARKKCVQPLVVGAGAAA